MEDLSNDYDLDNEDFDDDEDDDESNSIKDDGSQFSKSHKRKTSTDSSPKYNCKKRKCRTTFSKSQLNSLEKEFMSSNFVSNERIDSIIKHTGLDSRIIKVRIFDDHPAYYFKINKLNN